MLKGTFEDKDENGGVVEMGKAVGVVLWKKRWRLCEGCGNHLS